MNLPAQPFGIGREVGGRYRAGTVFGMGVVRLIGIRGESLSVDEVLAAVADEAAGGTVVFTGQVRDFDHGRSVTRLSYTAHESAELEMRQVAEKVAAESDAHALAAVHRTGELAIGDLAVVVAVSCAHRAAAFAACRALIDQLKAAVPIWKHQHFEDGSSEWVGSA